MRSRDGVRRPGARFCRGRYRSQEHSRQGPRLTATTRCCRLLWPQWHTRSALLLALMRVALNLDHSSSATAVLPSQEGSGRLQPGFPPAHCLASAVMASVAFEPGVASMVLSGGTGSLDMVGSAPFHDETDRSDHHRPVGSHTADILPATVLAKQAVHHACLRTVRTSEGRQAYGCHTRAGCVARIYAATRQ